MIAEAFHLTNFVLYALLIIEVVINTAIVFLMGWPKHPQWKPVIMLFTIEMTIGIGLFVSLIHA